MSAALYGGSMLGASPSWGGPPVSAPEAAAAAATPVHKMTLSELWQRASQHNPGIQATREAVAAARYTRDEQKWLRLPTGDFNAYMTWSPDIKCKTDTTLLQQSIGPDGVMQTLPLATGPDRCFETTASLNLAKDDLRAYLPIYGVLLRLNMNVYQPLYTFGKLDAALKLGNTGVKIAEAQSEATRADLAMNLLRAYFGLKTARAALDTIRDGHDQINQWIKQFDKDLDAGKGSYTEIDLMRLKVSESQINILEADVERTVKSTLAALRFLVQDPLADIDDSGLAVYENETRELPYYFDSALAGRPELKILNATGEGARLYRKLRIAEFLPDFALVFNMSYGLATSIEDPNHAFMNRFNYVGAGLGLGMRLGLDFGPKAARLQKAVADVRQFEWKKREALTGGSVEIERAYNDLIEANRRLKATESAERRARGWLQGVKQAIDVGAAETRDLVDALRTYFEQHIQVLRTINDVNVQAATLRRLSGLEVIPQ